MVDLEDRGKIAAVHELDIRYNFDFFYNIEQQERQKDGIRPSQLRKIRYENQQRPGKTETLGGWGVQGAGNVFTTFGKSGLQILRAMELRNLVT